MNPTRKQELAARAKRIAKAATAKTPANGQTVAERFVALKAELVSETPQNAPGSSETEIRCADMVESSPTQAAPQSVAPELESEEIEDDAPRARTTPTSGAQPEITLDQAADMVHQRLQGDVQSLIAQRVGMHQVTTSRYLGVTLPEFFPDVTQPTWMEQAKQDIIHFMAIATWKGTQRLAAEMDQIKLANLPVAAAICIDKHASLTGAPTSFAIVQHQSVDHRDLVGRLRSAKPNPQPIEAEQVK